MKVKIEKFDVSHSPSHTDLSYLVSAPNFSMKQFNSKNSYLSCLIY